MVGVAVGSCVGVLVGGRVAVLVGFTGVLLGWGVQVGNEVEVGRGVFVGSGVDVGCGVGELREGETVFWTAGFGVGVFEGT